MKHIAGQDRFQAFTTTLEERISADNPVRVIDAFVEVLPLEKMGFTKEKPPSTGRPSYEPKHLLKLYLYGYYNRIRSSRKLATECQRNLELQWLIQGLTPAYHTIADYRKEHPKALKEVFKSFVSFLKGVDLLGGDYVAIDGSKFRAVNSKKNNYNQAKIDRHMAYIENKTNEYLAALEEEDAADAKPSLKKKELDQALEQMEKHKLKYQALSLAIKESDDVQVSTTDAESRALILHRNIVEVSYNTQSAVDSKHNLLIHYEATNKNDFKALFKAAQQAKKTLGRESITVLADKGYHNGEQLSRCEKNGIITIVAFKDARRQSPVPTPEYYLDKFCYHKELDQYICPKGEVLKTNGSVYKKSTVCDKRKNPTPYTVKHYKTKACLTCVAMPLCTNNKYGRLIERNEYTEVVGRNNQRVIDQKKVYRMRQAIVEHPFGTMKRAWGYTYTLLKGLKKVDGEMGLIFTVYNLRRAVSILSVPDLVKGLKSWGKSYLPPFIAKIQAKTSLCRKCCFWAIEIQVIKLAT